MPGPTAVTFPLADTVATSPSEVDHRTVGSVASAGMILPVKDTLAISSICITTLSSSIEIPVTLTAFPPDTS